MSPREGSPPSRSAPNFAARIAAVLAATVALLLGGCALLGGQTGDDTGGGSPCGVPTSLAYDEPGRSGVSGAQLFELYGGTWSGPVAADADPGNGGGAGGNAGSTAGGAGGQGGFGSAAAPVTVSIEYRGGRVLEDDCELAVDVLVTLDLGSGRLHAGSAVLMGSPSEARLQGALAAVSSPSSVVALTLIMRPDGSGTLILTGAVTATVAVQRAR